MSSIVDFAYTVRVTKTECNIPYDKQYGHGNTMNMM